MPSRLTLLLLAAFLTTPAHGDFYDGLRAYDAKDYVGAFIEWEAGANAGDAGAQFRLGQLYAEGLGVPQNFLNAHLYLSLAAAQGHEEARATRDAVAGRMSAEQVAAAQQLAAEWKPVAAADAAASAAAVPDETAAPVPGGIDALLDAAARGDDARVRELLAAGIAPGDADAEGFTPLLVAALNGQVAVVSTLLQAGADANASRANGATALMAAAVAGHAQVVEVLLAGGADATLRNSSGTTARDLAQAKEHSAVVALLEAVSGPSREQVREAQALLNRAGHDAGPPDGVAGPRTLAAVRAYQAASGINADGVISAALIERLRTAPAAPRPVVAAAPPAPRRTPGSTFRDALKDGTQGPQMVMLQDGCFLMGSPASEQMRDDNERQHRVCVDAFAIGTHELSVGEFLVFVAATGYQTEAERNVQKAGCWGRVGGKAGHYAELNWRAPGFAQSEQQPVVCVSWNDAQAYAGWLARETGRRYRLPSEAEWEYAARAGSETAYPWGSAIGHNRANCDGCGSRWDNQQTAPVGSFAANAWGLHDTVGNVWEWTCSVYAQDYTGDEQRCASASADGDRALRGGSWLYNPRRARSAFRNWLGAWGRNDNVGFRLAQDLR